MHHVRPELLETAELVDVETLRFYPGNARRHADDKIEESLRAHGQYKALTVWRQTNEVLAGNGTFHNIVALGWTHCAVTWVDTDAIGARKIVLMDNASSDASENDELDLAELIAGLGGDYNGSGFDAPDFDELTSRNTARTFGDDLAQAGEIEPYNRYGRQQLIDAAVAHYRSAGFPFRALPAHECMQAIEKLAQTDTQTLRNTSTGYHAADTYHPHRFAVPIPGTKTPRQAFDEDKTLAHACGLILDDGGTITDTSLLGALGFARNAQAAANFRPGFALLMYRRYAESGDRVLDTSTGFGGRLLGFMASRCGEYVGIDPHPLTTAGNQRMVDDLLPADKSVTLLQQPAEDVDVDTIGRGSCDFAFTSPPYFSKERYAADDTQSWVRYPEAEQWRKGFLEPMLQLQFDALRSGAMNVVNIADVKIGKDSFPLEQWTIESGVELGFEYVRTDKFPLSRVPGRGVAQVRYEPLIVFRRP